MHTCGRAQLHNGLIDTSDRIKIRVHLQSVSVSLCCRNAYRVTTDGLIVAITGHCVHPGAVRTAEPLVRLRSDLHEAAEELQRYPLVAVKGK